MGLEEREERPDRPRGHHERSRPEGEGHRCAATTPETTCARPGVLQGSEPRIHPGITRKNAGGSLQTPFFLSTLDAFSHHDSAASSVPPGGAAISVRDSCAGLLIPLPTTSSAPLCAAGHVAGRVAPTRRGGLGRPDPLG